MSAATVLLGARTAAGGSDAAHLQASFAQRHIALPPALAVALAEFLASRQPLLDPVWGRAFGLMARALGLSGALASQSLMKGALDRFLLVVAEPVLRKAADLAGALPLVGAPLGGPDEAALLPAEGAVQRHTHAALSDLGIMGRAFWVHAALDLYQTALQATRARARLVAVTPNTECDPALAALVFLHPPQFDIALQREKPRRKARHLSAQRRAGIRPKEGGVAGIRQSHSFEDLSDALFSELIQGRALIANKLLHEGLLVRHRPPRRDPKRDLLSMTLHEAEVGDGMGTLVKAAWADAAIRLRVALHQMGLQNSDLVWSQYGGPPVALNCQPDLPGGVQLPPLGIAGKVRADMMMRSELFPAHAAVLNVGSPDRTSTPSSRMLMQLKAGMGQVAGTARRDMRGLAMDYGRRFVLVSQPYRGRHDPDWVELRAEQLAALGHDLGRCHHACLTWHSGTSTTPPQLVALADGREPLLLQPPQPGTADMHDALAAFMGQLVLWMMDVTLEALDVAEA
jgi:hypothetical protein